MKRLLKGLFCIVLILSMVACGKLSSDETVNTLDTTPLVLDSESVQDNSEEYSMQLFINDVEIPVIWEENDSVSEIVEEASKGDIVISMSMYGGNEQVGSLGKRYSSNDKQTTTHNGDIVLYNSSNLVVFYGSNSWGYTRLGKIDLSERKITDLLSNGDVTITIKK